MDWISVKDRLPDVNEPVRVKSDSAISTAKRTERGLWLIKIAGQWRNWLVNVTHWMPLPEPPGEAQP